MRRRDFLKSAGAAAGAAALPSLGRAHYDLPSGKVIWLEAEQFDDRGGWKVDTQAMDRMGAPFLLAAGTGEPVEDAVTTAQVPEAGTYRLWVRTRDWAPQHHPGCFRVALDDRRVEHVFGRSGRFDWRWEDGGSVRLKAGELEVRLQDLTGYFGRCDALMLTTDLGWKPPAQTAEIARLRREYGGVSADVENKTYDVVVTGGGLAGCTAAVAAGRNGASVALIQDRPVLGGNASTEILVPPVGVSPWVPAQQKHPLDPRETGIIEEYRTRGNQKIWEGKLYSQRLMRFVSQEPDVDLHLNTHGTGVEMGDAGHIKAVLARGVRTGRRLRFRGELFIDCTGDGVTGLAAGADYRYGRESKAMHGEPWAPEEPDDFTMGNGVKMAAEEFDSPQPYEGPEWPYEFSSCDNFQSDNWHPSLETLTRRIGVQWKWEMGGCRNPCRDAEYIRDDLLKLNYGLWDHVKNHCDEYGDAAENASIVWGGHIAGKRESYRLMGDYILTQNDLGRDEPFHDAVAFGGWGVDDHPPAGFFGHAHSPDYCPPKKCLKAHEGQERKKKYKHRGELFSIPFRSLYSRNVDNLLMAGRDISVTHLALGSTRVMLTCAVIGHAVGTASAMCVDRGVTPRTLGRNHIDALQRRLLKEGAYLIGQRYEDPDNLAFEAEASASSEGTYDEEPMPAENVTDGFHRLDRGHPHAWMPSGDASGEHWVELQWQEPVSFNVVHVYFQRVQLAPHQFRVEARVGGQWQTLKEVSRNRHRRHVLGVERVTTRRLRVVEDDPCGICAVRVYDEPERVVESARRAHRTMRTPDRPPFLPWNEPGVGADEDDADLDLEGVVVDAPRRMARTRRRGAWTTSTYTTPYLGRGYIHDQNAGKGRKSVAFSLAAPESGRYEVRLAYTAAPNRAGNAPVHVEWPGGSTTVTIDQREEPPINGHFYALTTVRLEEGQDVTVRVTNDGTDGYVVVDAVQMVPVD